MIKVKVVPWVLPAPHVTASTLLTELVRGSHRFTAADLPIALGKQLSVTVTDTGGAHAQSHTLVAEATTLAELKAELDNAAFLEDTGVPVLELRLFDGVLYLISAENEGRLQITSAAADNADFGIAVDVDNTGKPTSDILEISAFDAGMILAYDE